MGKKSYFDLLKDPRWQKRRLEILQGSNFSCDNCGDDESTLHVHHTVYLKNTLPWDYPEPMVHCLCEICHEIATETTEKFKMAYGQIAPVYLERLIEIIAGHINQEDIKSIQKAVFACCELLGLDDRILAPIAELMRYKRVVRNEIEKH